MRFTIGCIALLLGMTAIVDAQMHPVLQAPLSRGDTKVSGTAQAPTSNYSVVQILLCTSIQAPGPGADCSGPNGPNAATTILPLTNLAGAPFAVTSPDGKFSVTLASPLVGATYVWVIQRTVDSSTGQPVIKASNAALVRTPLIQSASLSFSGTDSASRDLGSKATLNLQRGRVDHAAGQTRLFLTANYDDKWKSKPLSSNVTELFSGQLAQYWQFHPGAYVGPFAMAYRNNTQGIRVEQTYGFGAEKDSALGGGRSIALGVWPEGKLEDLYSPGQSVNLFGVELRADFVQPLGATTGSMVTKLTYTPTLNQTHDWAATGLWSLNLPINAHWSTTISLQDNYYEIAPKTFNKNYLLPSIGITFK